MSKSTSKHQPSADIGTDLRPLDGDASGSIEQQLASLDRLHDHEANQAEDQESWSDGRSKAAGGLHSAEALSQHVKNWNGPRYSGHSKPFGKQ